MSSGAASDPQQEIRTARSTVFRGRLLSVHRDEVSLPDGRPATREVVEHPGAVAIVVRAPDGRIVLVRQWRHATGRALWEIPAGTAEPGEDPAETARRELREETGWSAAGWRRLAAMPVSPGYSGEILTIFSALDPVGGGETGGDHEADADENLEVGLFSPAEIQALVAEDALDLKTVAGLALAGLLPASP